MGDDRTSHAHPAADQPEDVRRDYLTAVASMAFADGLQDPAETSVLRSLCEALGLPASALDAVTEVASQGGVAHAVACAARFRDNGLATSLLTDAIAVTFADHRVDPAESNEIADLAHALGIQVAQARMLARHVEAELQSVLPPGAGLSNALGDALSHQTPAPSGGFLGWLFGRRRDR